MKIRGPFIIIALLSLATNSYAQIKPIRVAKWSTLTLSTGSLMYGYFQNRAADRDYADIERLCQNNPLSCARLNDTGPYADAALESRYQGVLRRDDRAKFALIAGEVGLLTSLALFIIDLPSGSTTKTIPYNPKALRLQLGFHQFDERVDYSRVELRATVPTDFIHR